MTIEDSMISLKNNLNISNNFGDLIVDCLLGLILSILKI